MLSTKNFPKTVVLKSPDSDKVREVIVTSVFLPKSENNINRTQMIKSFRSSEGVVMEKRTYKRRLDHLTLEEKIMRKKLKNREAAQTSRDRKKARMEELEVSMSKLQNENESLLEQVQSLKSEKESLERENARLSEQVWRLSVGCSSCGSAESRPLPKGASLPPALRHHTRPRPAHPRPPTLLHTLACLLSLSTSRCSTIGLSTKTPSPLSSTSWNNWQTISSLKLAIQKKKKQRRRIWWGRKQRSWNPVGHALKARKL